MGKVVKISTWEELAQAKSPTHILDIDLEYGCGWIHPKEEVEDRQSLEGHYYLSTHTFYDSSYKGSTELLQSCGFNVELISADD